MDPLFSVAVTILLIPVIALIVLYITMPPKPSTADLKKVLQNFSKQGNLMTRMRRKTKPGEPCHNFEHFLGLCHETIEMDRVGVAENTLSYRYKLPKDKPLTAGLAIALMDETTAGLMAFVGKPAGASLFFQINWSPKGKKMMASSPDDDDYVDIVNTLSKYGNTVAHSRTDFVSSDQEIIGYSTHTKYLPTGSPFLDAFLKYYPPWLSPKLSELADQKLSAESPTPKLELPGVHEIIDSNLKVSSDGTGEFSMQDEHNNPFGGLHGGCTAMVMEKVADPYAKALLKSDSVLLETLQVQFFQGGRGRPTLKLESEIIDVVENSHVMLRVNLMKETKSKKSVNTKGNVGVSILAQGVLKFVLQK